MWREGVHRGKCIRKYGGYLRERGEGSPRITWTTMEGHRDGAVEIDFGVECRLCREHTLGGGGGATRVPKEPQRGKETAGETDLGIQEYYKHPRKVICSALPHNWNLWEGEGG